MLLHSFAVIELFNVNNCIMAKTALLIGSTGLIGSHLLRYLCSDERYSLVRILVRSKISGLDFNGDKVEQHLVEFNCLNEYAEYFNCDDAFVCVGTTIKKVKGDKMAFRKVDFEIPVAAAQIAAENNVKGFFVISSIGADAGSNNFYLKTKGEMENAVQQIKFDRISFLRPSLLLGLRKENRAGERLAQLVMKPLALLFKGPLKKYKPVESASVAMALIEIANTAQPKLIYEGQDIADKAADHLKKSIII